MSNEAIRLHSLFKQWYRDPKYCNHVNFIGGLAYSFIKKNGFSDDVIKELIKNNIIEQDSETGYKLTEEAIKDYMTPKGNKILEVEQIKTESQQVINSINTETLETQKESLELISKQLDKVNEAIKKNLTDEEIRLQLRDIENNLKYNYSGLSEMIEAEELKKEKADKQDNKIKVTHNEYEKICKELASRIYAKDKTKITMKEYDKMLDNYEILPFGINTDNEELKKVINIYADNETIEDDRTVYRGSIDKSILYNLLNESTGYKDLYIEYYQMIICNDNLKVILTYCEGDFIAEVYNSESEYIAGVERTKKFIEEM